MHQVLVYLWYLIQVSLLLVLQHCRTYIIKITVTVTPCDINPVDIFHLWSSVRHDSPRGIQVLESLNLGHCKTSAATASHTSAIMERDI